MQDQTMQAMMNKMAEIYGEKAAYEDRIEELQQQQDLLSSMLSLRIEELTMKEEENRRLREQAIKREQHIKGLEEALRLIGEAKGDWDEKQARD